MRGIVMIWSDKCVNPEKGFDFMEDGTMRPRAYGYWVYTLEECDNLLRQRGDWE